MNRIWAKAAPPDAAEGQSLAAHTLAVVASATTLLQTRPGIARYAGDSRFAEWLLLAAASHDLGKTASGFQAALRERGRRWGHRHEVASLFFMIPLLADADAETRFWTTAAVLSHHRDCDRVADLYRAIPGCPADLDPLQQFSRELDGDAYAAVFRWARETVIPLVREALSSLGIRSDSPVPEAPDLQGPAPLVADVRETLDRYLRHVAMQRTCAAIDPATRRLGIALRGGLILADHAASAGEGEFTPSPLRHPPDVYERAGLPTDTLYSHQQASRATHCPVIVSAPTGSGKTETSLGWVHAGAEVCDPGARVYYVLPYQASMNAMLRRLVDEYHYPKQAVGLLHGRALQALYAREAVSDEQRDGAARRARTLAQLTRLHKSAVTVLSPYQLLKTVYQLPGYEASLTDLIGADVIVDEVHAYEPQRAGMIAALFAHLVTEFNARFCIMTATLPEILRSRLTQAIPALLQITASGEEYAAFRRHQVRMHSGELDSEAGLDAIVATAAAGAGTLVCCNTVAGAQAVYDRLRSRLPSRTVDLLHGRFNARDRNAKEKALLDAMSPTAGRRAEAPILVATQVVEVSLNVSFDTIYTEPAPLDALLQRFGRVNRKPQDRRVVDVHVFDRPQDGQGIYDPHLVGNTVGILSDADGQVIDEGATGAWLDAAYAAEVGERWAADFDAAFADFTQVIRRLYPFQSSPEMAEVFYSAFDGVDVLPACLADEHTALSEGEPLAASALLVGISHRQLGRLRRGGLVQKGPEPNVSVVDVPYDEEYGLRL